MSRVIDGLLYVVTFYDQSASVESAYLHVRARSHDENNPATAMKLPMSARLQL
jgi:hypothetical protein